MLEILVELHPSLLKGENTSITDHTIRSYCTVRRVLESRSFLCMGRRGRFTSCLIPGKLALTCFVYVPVQSLYANRSTYKSEYFPISFFEVLEYKSLRKKDQMHIEGT